MNLEQLKAEYSAWSADECPVNLRVMAAWISAEAFPSLVGEIERLRSVLNDIKEYAEGHHAQEETCVWLHSLTVDIPSRIEIALGQPPDKPSGAT